MATDLDIFTWLPQTGAQGSVTPAIVTAQFGDGYSQDIALGINSTPQVWTLTFNNMPDVADSIWAFLQKQGGVARFWWTPPRMKTPIKVKTTGACTKTETDTLQVTIQATFTQVFDPD